VVGVVFIGGVSDLAPDVASGHHPLLDDSAVVARTILAVTGFGVYVSSAE
jgi:hypothetical protein